MDAQMDVHRFDRANHCRQIGGKGGEETVRRYGVAYMHAIAAIGFQATTDKFYGGNRAHARAALIARGRHFAARPT